MANSLPIDSYGNFTQQQENQANENEQFWQHWYGQFNPQAQVAQGINANPQFQQAGDYTKNFMKSQMQPGAAPGSFDTTAFARNLGNQQSMLGNQANQNSSMQAFNSNAKEGNNYGEAALGRMNNMGNLQNEMNELPVQREGQNFNTSDYINSMWNKWNNDQEGWGNILGQGIGNVAGGALGNKLFAPPQQTVKYGPGF